MVEVKVPEYTIIVKLKDDDPKELDVHIDYSGGESDDWWDIPTHIWKGAAISIGEIWEKCEKRM